MRCLEHGAQLVVGDFRNRPPRRDAGFPERLRLPEVADARDEPLVEQGIADRALRIAAEVGDHGVQIGRLREDVRPESADDAVVQLQHRAIPEHGFPLGAAENEPGTAEELRASRPELPAAGHTQVAAENDAILEAEEQVLTRRLDPEQAAAVEALDQPLHRRPRVRRLDLDPLAHERLQPPCCPGQRIAFRHCATASGLRASVPRGSRPRRAAASRRSP